MNADRLTTIAGSIVTLAMITTVVTRGGAAAQVIKAVGDLFAGSLRTAMGR